MSELGPAFHDLSVVIGFRALAPIVSALLLLLCAWRAGRCAPRSRALLLVAGVLRLASAACIGTLAWSIDWLAQNVDRASSSSAEAALVFALSYGGPLDAVWIGLLAGAVFTLPRASA